MKVEHLLDADEVNAAINVPEVLAYVAPGYDSFDVSEFVADTENVCLRCGEAVAIFACNAHGQFEGHFLFPASVRGARAVEAAQKMLAEMFTTHGADTIHGLTPRSLRAARVMSRRLGFEPVGAGRNNLNEECVRYALTRDKWAESLV